MAAKKVKPIDDYLKPKIEEEEEVLVQSNIYKSLHTEFKTILKREERTIDEVIEALIKRYVDEKR